MLVAGNRSKPSPQEPMGIVYPSKAVARRWDGALQARLRRAPVETFLRARSIVAAPAGVSQGSDNLVRATVFIVQAGIARYVADCEGRLVDHRRSGIAVAACLVSLGLAQQFSQPDAWRVVALVSSAQLLSPLMGLNTAALESAAVVRAFDQEIKHGISPPAWRIITGAQEAIRENDPDALLAVTTGIATRLRSESAVVAGAAVPELRERNRSS
jgi:hypothetical protein